MIKRLYFCLSIIFVLVFISCSKGAEESVVVNLDTDTDLSDSQINVLKNIEIVGNKVETLLGSCEEIDEINNYLQEINSLEGVEQAWVDENQSFCVKMVGGGIVTWSILEEDVFSSHGGSSLFRRTGEQSTRSVINEQAICEDRHVCFINQTSYDPNLQYVDDWLNEYISDVNNSGNGFTVKKINAEEFTLEFLKNSLPQFGTIVLIAHGGYGKESGLHWTFTRDKKWTIEKYNYWEADLLRVNNVCKKENFGICSEKERYFLFCEKYLDEIYTSNSFLNNSIMFNVACHSLEGSHNIWNVLKRKGLGCYLGYNNTVHCEFALSGIDMFFYDMVVLKKNTAETYNTLDYYDRISDPQYPHAKLIYCSDYPVSYYDSQIGCPDNNHPHMVDLGLPSGTKWACCNLGASTPEDYGDYFVWGTTVPIEELDDDYDEDDDEFPPLGNDGDIGGTEYDVAFRTLGSPWRMPDWEMSQELLEECNKKWTTMNGIDGLLLTGPNGNYIFMPANGSWDDGIIKGLGLSGNYWTSELEDYFTTAHSLFFKGSEGSLTSHVSWSSYWYGHGVRPVSK